jgi:hypothetical protein
MHNCPDCGLAHDEPARSGPDPVVKVAQIEAERDIEVAKIQAGVTRDEMMAEMAQLRAELTVRQEEPPVAETEITQVTEVDEPEPQELPVDLPAEPVDDEPPPPPEAEPVHNEPKSKGWFG